jgi:hypothetical protein
MNDVERMKMSADYYKHLNTLSIGSIVLISAFLEKFSRQPQWKWLVALSLLGFLFSVLSIVAAFSLDLIYIESNPSKTLAKIQVSSLYTAWTGFFVGVIALTVFALKNL